MIRHVAVVALLVACSFNIALAADPKPAAPAVPAAAPKPKAKITPGKPIVPTGAGEMRRLWGELISVDLTTRTGKFRKMDDDVVYEFVVMPYAELLHHAGQGDLQDYLPTERALFRLHEDENGVWKYLTYIQDEMNFLNGHKEWYYVTVIEKGRFKCDQANENREQFTREKDVYVDVDAETKYFRGGQEVKLEDVKIGDRMQIKAHGVGKGQKRIAWYVFLDSESVQKFAAEQKGVHAERMQANGFPGYVDVVSAPSDGGSTIEMTLFGWARDYSKGIKVGQSVKLAPAGVDMKPTAAPIEAKISVVKSLGHNTKLTLQSTQKLPAGVEPTNVVRVWVPQILEPATK